MILVAKRTSSRPTWSELKKAVVNLDQKQLIKLVADLYRFSKDNQVFLHARFAVGDDPVSPYKKTVNECMYPDIYSNKPIQISKINQFKSRKQREQSAAIQRPWEIPLSKPN
jgi:hypothetical protein